jgi:hypothetical protein
MPDRLLRRAIEYTKRSCLLVFDPNSHARLKADPLSFRVEAQAKCIAIMIPNNPLGLWRRFLSSHRCRFALR